MSERKNWYVVCTRTLYEKKVAGVLSRKNIENYYPLNKVVRNWNDRRKIIHEPLFASYVFVRITDEVLSSLKQIDGVISIIYWLGRPAVISDIEINAIRDFLVGHVNVKLQKNPIDIADKVSVLSSPLIEETCQSRSVKNRTVTIALPSIGYLLYAEEETGNVELLPRNFLKQPGMNYPLTVAVAK